ncbi:YSIRK-type signal peptide-containing protein [Streptococcus suis]|nr:YSIRK-type signal peptide-containing protein [Streptococcus suis]
MRKNNKKSFNWYGMRQHFSIRKYHFGAASVLLGMSLALGAGGQAVKAEETAASSEALASTTATSSTQASSEVVPATSVEATTEVAATERTATINYIVQYLLEDGTLVDAVVKSATVTTTDATAKTTVDVTAELPEGYVLAEGQATIVTQVVTEGAENLVTVQLVKKAEEVAPTTEAATEAPATTTEAATETPADATEVAAAVTAEEAKVVLEQVTSEAEVLANEAERLVAASDSDNTALKAAAAATKLTVTEATTVLKDSVATLVQVNAQIDAVRTNVEALALELRKYSGTDVIEIALNTSLSTDLKVGDGTGILIETGTTATPSMDDANGAVVKPHTLRAGISATSQTGWYTFDSYDFNAYNDNQPELNPKGAPIDAYIRYSLDENANTSTILAELVSTTTGEVLETHTIEAGTSVTLSYPQTVHPNNEVVTIKYDETLAADGSTQGSLDLSGPQGGKYSTIIVPDYQVNVTKYVVENENTVLATYSLQTIGGQPVTSSDKREFAGYTYTTTTKEAVQGGLPVGTVYLSGKVNVNTLQYKAIRKVVANNQVITEYYFLDPTYTGTVDWTGIDTTGFIKLLETSPLVYTDGLTYDYNKNSTIFAAHTLDPDTGLMVFKESPVNDQGSKYRVVAQWSGTGDTGGTYGRIYIGTQVYTPANTADPEFKWRGTNDTFVNKGFVPAGTQQNLRNAAVATAYETTHWYTPIPQIAQIIYQTEDGTQLDGIDTETGNPGELINYSTTNRINAYKLAGYELVSDGGPQSGQDATYDYTNDDATDPSQKFYVVLKERVKPVDPTDPNTPTPKPGEPVDPTDPNSPVWPDSVKDLVTTEEVTRTITYVDKDGNPVFETVTETKEFTRTAEINLVTGEITYGEWTPAQTFEDVPSPLLDGYIADIKVVSTDPVNAEDADIEIVVTYKQLGSWVPELPEGETPVPPITYPNDPNEDPTIPGQPTPTPGIPEIPGYVPVGPDGNELPKDPNTGQYIPPVPVDPTVDTPIRYVKQEQQATITFVNVTDPANPVTLVTIPLDGVTGDQFGYDTDPVVANYQKAGYTVTNKNNYSKDGVYSADPADHDVFVFELVQRVEVVDPNDPNTPTPKPGEPVDPTDPNSPVWPETVKDLVTTEEVTRIISYVDNQGNTVFESVTETKKFTRTADINLVTGVITYGEWTPAQTMAEVTSPKKENHLVSLPVVGEQEVTAVDPDINVTVVYTPLGSWVPVVPPGYPEVPETVYPVDPTDPTKPGTDVPTIPYIPGIVPTIPNPDNPDETIPLQPVNPNDPTKGYEVPPVPEDPSQNTPITYVLADQKATVNYVDEAGNPILSPVELTGKSGADLGYSTLPTIEDLKKKGYELVSNDYPEGGSFDKDALVDQVYTVVLKERVVPVDPTDPNTPTPKPGEPVDPTDPNSPVWPDSVKDLVTKEEVTRTITYVDNTGKTVFETVTETKEFTRTAEINLVTGVITYGEWTPVQTFEDVTSPLLANHLVDTPVVKGQDVNATDPDINVTVVYTPLGSWVPVVPPGFPEVPETAYPVDPTDPTKPGTEVPTVPHIPGTTPVTPDPENPGTFIPLTPVDPEDPSKGYEVPPVPTDPTKDTPIVYVEDNKQLASVTIVDESTGNTISTFFEQGKPGFKVGINTDEKLAELTKAGYTVTSDEYNDSDKVYDKDDNVDQSWTIKVTPRIEPVDPTNPPKPGEPVDPTDPNSPVWPDSVKDLVTTQEVVRTITYVNEAGETVATEVVQKVNFTRTAQVNLVTGEITYGEWTPAQELPAVSSPVVAGYYTETPLVDPTTVNAEDADVTVTVVYKKLGNWIPNVPGEQVPPIPYPNDPEDPSKPGVPTTPVVPVVPGYVPVGPDGKELPKDPDGNYIPPVPTTPGVDTPIDYVAVDQKAIVNYVDENGNSLATSGDLIGKSDEVINYSTTPTIEELLKKGYELVNNEFPEGATYDKDGNVDQVFTVTLKERVEPVDPTNPPKPGEPVDPTDPNSPVWPDSVKDLVTTQEVVRTITYVNEDGETVSAEVVQKVSFTRTAQVNLVTGEITYGEWTPAQELPAVSSPVVAGYYTETPLVDPATVNAEDVDVTVTVVYKKLGNWIPNIPGQPVNPLPYPNHPTDPSKPGVPEVVIPYVPGYVPVDPNGNPLTPVDPEDPTKGYIPPTPEFMKRVSPDGEGSSRPNLLREC